MTLPKKDSLELRVLELVRDHYPITKDELLRRLGVSRGKMELALKRLAARGMVEFDVLPDKTYVRLKVVPAGPKARRDAKKARKGKEQGKGDPVGDFSYM